jgi:hypothetical protein
MPAYFKAIRPARLKGDKLRLHLLNEMRKIGRDIKRDFERTVRTWEEKPEFEILISLSGGITVVVETNSEIYRYVDKGTEPHLILPVSAKVLHFKSNFIPKTQPGVIDSGPGGSGGEDVFAAYVFHPGIKAREFEKTIYRKWRRLFKRRMEEAMKRGVAASGHRI